MSKSAAIPGRPDRRPRPARAKAAAIVATTVKARPAEIVPVAIVPVITWGWIDIPGAPVTARHPRNRSSLSVSWKAVIRGLIIARQEAVAVPAWRRPVMSRGRRRDDRQQRQDDSNRQKHQARHNHTIDGRLSGGDSNLSAQASATVNVIRWLDSAAAGGLRLSARRSVANLRRFKNRHQDEEKP